VKAALDNAEKVFIFVVIEIMNIVIADVIRRITFRLASAIRSRCEK
jgi:hypothetical protein